MARPEKLRKVGCMAGGRAFKPIGRPVGSLEVEELRLDELEALRLADLQGLYQEAAAERMGVSRPTFARILARARTAVARALIEERVLSDPETAREIAASGDTAGLLETAIQVEKDSVLFYSELLSEVDEGDVAAVQKIIDEEKQHVRLLVAAKEKLNA